MFSLSETPNTNIYFTADGTKPNPFNRIHLGKEQTFKYKGPFTLNVGRRTLRAVAVHRYVTQHSPCYVCGSHLPAHNATRGMDLLNCFVPVN